jgi:hypothetical protein
VNAAELVEASAERRSGFLIQDWGVEELKSRRFLDVKTSVNACLGQASVELRAGY